MENIKIQVNNLTDEYEKRSAQITNLEEAVKKGRLRLEEIEKRLRELIHVK
jgi:chaperonin cofactor prefoldin